VPNLVAAAVAVALAAAVALTSCTPAGAPPGEATVVEVVDGDTIVVDLGGRREHVRLLGIDTPETKRPGTPVECYGPEASARTAALLPEGAPVRLERDVEPRDRYGRLLAYVTTADGTAVNESLVRDGFADTLWVAPNGARRPVLDASAAEARRAGRGLWGACGGPHEPGHG
jgi:micrococcal nuclease